MPAFTFPQLTEENIRNRVLKEKEPQKNTMETIKIIVTRSELEKIRLCLRELAKIRTRKKLYAPVTPNMTSIPLYYTEQTAEQFHRISRYYPTFSRQSESILRTLFAFIGKEMPENLPPSKIEEIVLEITNALKKAEEEKLASTEDLRPQKNILAFPFSKRDWKNSVLMPCERWWKKPKRIGGTGHFALV